MGLIYGIIDCNHSAQDQAVTIEEQEMNITIDPPKRNSEVSQDPSLWDVYLDSAMTLKNGNIYSFFAKEELLNRAGLVKGVTRAHDEVKP